MMLSSVRSVARLPLATRVAKRAFSDVTSTSIVLSRHPAVDSIVAYRTTKGEESILALVVMAQSRDIPLPNLGELRQVAYNNGFTGVLQGVQHALLSELVHPEKREMLVNNAAPDDRCRFARDLKLAISSK